MALTKKPIGSAAVILDQERRVLLVRHTYGKLNWELPGGAAEPNESVEETAMREVLRLAAKGGWTDRCINGESVDREAD